MRKIAKREEKRRAQVWFFRYDCIVNAAFPRVALTRCTEENVLTARHFTGQAATQALKPVVISQMADIYMLESPAAGLTLTCSGDSTRQQLTFARVTSDRDGDTRHHWHLIDTNSSKARHLIQQIFEQSKSIVKDRRW